MINSKTRRVILIINQGQNLEQEVKRVKHRQLHNKRVGQLPKII